MIHLTLIVERVNAEHRHINMGILHSCILPVNQANHLFAIFLRKQEIIRHRINMGQDFFPGMCINIRFQRQNIRLCSFVVFIYRRCTVPQCFIELHLTENIKLMIHFQLHLMEAAQPFHALFDIFVVQRVTYSGSFHKCCDFIAIFRVDVCNIIADMLSVNGLINCGFLTAVYQLVGSLSRNTHDIFLSFTSK